MELESSHASPRTDGALVELGRRVDNRAWAATPTAWSWPEGVFLLGSIQFAASIGDEFPSRVLAYLDQHLAAGITVGHVNNLAPGSAAILAASATGDDRYLDLVAPLADWLRTDPAASRAHNGALEHWPGSVWADTTFMAGVFLGRLGAATHDPALIAEFGRQLVAHAEILQDPDSGLYAHGSHRGERIACHWGRGNAWCALAAVQFLELAHDHHVTDELADAVREALRRQLRTLAVLQPPSGIWEVLVDGHPETAGVLDTSAAAGIGAAMLRAAPFVQDEDKAIRRAGRRAIDAVVSQVDREGMLSRVSAGTILQLLPFGYSVIRNDLLQFWGQGLALHAVAAAIADSVGASG